MHYAYMLRCSDNSIYSGYTTDLRRRLDMHNAGTASKCTRARRPVVMIYYEEFENKGDALRREAALKRLSHEAKEKLALSFDKELP